MTGAVGLADIGRVNDSLRVTLGQLLNLDPLVGALPGVEKDAELWIGPIFWL